MADYRLSVQFISRSDNRSAVAAAAYRAGDCLADERGKMVHDYTRKGGVVHSEIMAPETAPGWVHDRESLWNAVEATEKRKDAQVAKEVQLSLPAELNAEQRLALARVFVAENFVAKGMVADVAIHAPPREGDARNHHAHVLLTTRKISPDGFLATKNREWNSKEQLHEWRENWAKVQNKHLVLALGEEKAREKQVSHQSYAERGIAKAPGRHIGPEATAMERKGERTRRGQAARQSQQIQEIGAELKEQIAARTVLPGTKNLVALAVEMEGIADRMKGEKAQAEQRLRAIQEKMKVARRITQAAIKKESIAPLERAEFEAKQELERREAEAKSGRDLDAKTILRWVTNPAEMLWKTAREQLARDGAANAAGAKLKNIQAQKKEALAWLKTPQGSEFIKARVAEIRASSPEMFEAAERVRKAEKTRSSYQNAMKTPQGKEIIAAQVKKIQGDLGALRTEERKARRNIRQLDRNIKAASRTAKVARDMFENDLPSSVRLPSRTLGDTRYVKAAFGEMRRNLRALNPEQQKALTLNLRRVLSLGLGG
ncbi:MobQ family relaxase [Acidithiobacillus sp.]|uniref:MobQ family relaxase n=1 Tax=Acidithiobacillus sp. TaxID=1872118 RepID=UPI0031FE714A